MFKNEKGAILLLEIVAVGYQILTVYTADGIERLQSVPGVVTFGITITELFVVLYILWRTSNTWGLQVSHITMLKLESLRLNYLLQIANEKGMYFSSLACLLAGLLFLFFFFSFFAFCDFFKLLNVSVLVFFLKKTFLKNDDFNKRRLANQNLSAFFGLHVMFL